MKNTDAKQRILNSAQVLMLARGYAGTKVDEICEHAGVSKGSFYHFFPSKRDLTLAVLDHFQSCADEDGRLAFAPEDSRRWPEMMVAPKAAKTTEGS